MLTGMFSNFGFHLGDNYEYLKKDKANPKGYFEDYEVNTINEDILKETLYNIPESIRKRFFPSFTFYRARWLSRLPLYKNLKTNKNINDRITKLVVKTPFCYKDPRFSYTLPIWKTILDKNNIPVKYLVVYREPYKTAKSIVKECEESIALSPLRMNEYIALKIWWLMYSHILKNYENDENKDNWKFIHFNQLFSMGFLEEVEEFVGTTIDRQFPDRQLSRAIDEEREIKSNLLLIYNRLNQLSGY